MEPIQLRFTHTEEEYLAAARLLLLKSKGVLPALFMAYFLIASLLVLLLILTGAALPLWFMTAIMGLLGVALWYRLFIDYPRRHFRGDPKFRDEYLLTFSEEGVACKTSQIDSKLAWSLYTGALENEEMYVLLYGTGTNMITAVPKRAFRSRMQEEAFRDLLKRHIGSTSLAAGTPKKLAPESAYVPPRDGPPDWR
jgi:hypothetical protein